VRNVYLQNVVHLAACAVQYCMTIRARVRSSLGTLGRDPIKIHETPPPPPPIRPIRLASVGRSGRKKIIKTNRINHYTVVYICGVYVTRKERLYGAEGAGGFAAVVAGSRFCIYREVAERCVPGSSEVGMKFGKYSIQLEIPRYGVTAGIYYSRPNNRLGEPVGLPYFMV